MAAARNQPTYDFLSGGSPPPSQPLRETFRQSLAVRPDHGNEELRAQINTLQYELDSLKQERELTALRHQKELRDIQNKAEADFRRAQASESSSNATSRKCEALARELQDTQDRCANEKLDLERKIRTLQDQNTTLREEVEEARTELSSLERQSSHRYNELETRHNVLQGTVDELRAEVDAKVNALRMTQQKLSQKEEEAGQLESEVVRLKTQTGDADSLALVKREFSEQIAHIKKLEATNREYQAELRQLRKQQKSVEVVEEEKRTLEGKVRIMDDLRKELAEAQLQRQILEDERKAWTAYLESQALSEGELNFDSPEDVARAFVRERLEVASLMERLGAIQPELAVKEENIKSLEDEKAKLLAEVEKLRSSGGSGDSKLRNRLERQRTLAVKEVEYLRAQLKAFDSEESEFHAESYDEQKTKQIQELENMVDAYRKELQTLHIDLSAAEQRLQSPEEAPQTGTKRRRDSADDERLGELRRKNRQLQDDISALQTRNAVLEADLKAHEAQLAALKASSRTRILELRSNPTANAEALKMSTLAQLREENRILLERLEDRLSSASSEDGKKLVPLATLELARLDLEEARAALASAEKRTLRLKQVFASKSKEFRDAVASILGWKLEFRPNGRVKATSVFYPGGGGEDEEGEEHFIEFDGEKGTMKVSGGPQSEFAKEIRGVIEEWVERRKEIPCFLAALTLEFWERSRGENV